MSAIDVQIGGDHYKKFEIQPVEYLMKFGKDMDWCQKNMIKYLARYPDKNGIEDIRKVYHYGELRHDLIRLQKPFKPEEFFDQFHYQDALLMQLVAAGQTDEAVELVRQMIRDSL